MKIIGGYYDETGSYETRQKASTTARAQFVTELEAWLQRTLTEVEEVLIRSLSEEGTGWHEIGLVDIQLSPSTAEKSAQPHSSPVSDELHDW